MGRLVSIVLAIFLSFSTYAVADDPSDLKAMLDKGAAFVQRQDYESAEICYDIAMKLSPDDPVVYDAVSAMHFAMTDYEQSLKYLEKAISLTPSDGSLYIKRAKILFICDRIDEAELALRYAEICGNQADSDLRITAATAYANNGYYAQSIELFDATESEYWWNEYSELYGRALIRSGNKERAEQLGLIVVGSKDTALEAMVQNDQALDLVAYEESISSYPLYCSVAYYEENKEAAQEEGILGELSADGAKIKISDSMEEMDMGEAALLAVSPSGEASIYSIGGMLAVCRNDEVLVITPNYVRGAQNDEYASLTYRYSSRLGTMFEQDSVVWSPDERYFALTFPSRTLIMAQFLDLMLVDTKTGDLFVVEATPKKPTIDGCQTTICACFDESGENVYYLVYGQVGTDSRCGIKKYNLATGSVELLCETYDTIVDRPGLFMDDDGNIRGITDVIKADQHAGTIVFSLADGKWQYTVSEFENSMQTQLPVRYLYSNNSKVELAINRLASSNQGAEMYLTINTDCFNEVLDNTAIMLPLDGSVAEIVNVDEAFTATILGDVVSQTDETASRVSPWMNIQNVSLSPDGYFALVQAFDGNHSGIYILDLISLKYIELNLPSGTQLVPVKAGSTANGYRMDWIGSDKVMIPTTLGNVVYCLEQE